MCSRFRTCAGVCRTPSSARESADALIWKTARTASPRRWVTPPQERTSLSTARGRSIATRTRSTRATSYASHGRPTSLTQARPTTSSVAWSTRTRCATSLPPTPCAGSPCTWTAREAACMRTRPLRTTTPVPVRSSTRGTRASTLRV